MLTLGSLEWKKVVATALKMSKPASGLGQSVEDVHLKTVQIIITRLGRVTCSPVRAAQRTWDWLMRAQLKSEGKPYDISASKEMQGERWLRQGSMTCGLELLPLPSPNINVWHYNRFSNDPILRDRASYSAAMLPSRKAKIKAAIDEHRPRNVVFYSKRYLAHWQEIVGVGFDAVGDLHFAKSDDTSFFCTMHPTAQIKGAGRKKAYWENIGALLANAE